MCLLIAVVVVGVVLWLWMLVNCVGRAPDAFAVELAPREWNKLAWLLLLVVLGVIGAALYWWFIYAADLAPAAELRHRRLQLQAELKREQEARQIDALAQADQRGGQPGE